MYIKNLLGTFRNKLVNALMPFQNYNIGDHRIVAIRGTIRNKRDQDDAWLYELLNQSNTYFDIGCNVGFTALMGLVQKDLRAILVDPSPEALSLASKNIIKNSLSKNVSFYPAFVSDKNGEEIDFYSNGWEAASSMYSSHAKTAARQQSIRKVKTITIDHLVEYYNIIPDLVKIDVEGAELQVLNGSWKLASHQSTMFFIEMHSLDERPMKESGDFVINWCNTNNYKAYYLTNHILFNDSKMIASRGKCHLLLLPGNMEYPKNLNKIKARSKIKSHH